ncbi:major facilitator superfamily domain-containing protein [Crucibulum laeve]|uniref:Major facilitator superfamily domain-containing protein n=1 Tax=Crucibulum laeve TaxID=68775 RepID=A0A5C3M3J8_9AGAR|nr:major facilitator superfamily domain-containing protein [Crucibulum laeve]
MSGDLEDTISEETQSEWGLRSSLTVIGAFLALFCTFGQMNAFGTFQTWYTAHQLQHMPASTISWIGSLQLWVFFFSGGPIGYLFDIYGPTGLMIAGTLCYVTSIMMTSICTRYYQYILSQGILFGLGVGLLFYPALWSVSTHFSKHRATAVGVASAGSSFGGVVYPIMLQKLFQEVGFGWGVRVSGLVSAAGCIAATLCVSSRSSDRKSKPCFDIKTLIDTPFALLAAGSCLVALGLFIPFFYIVEYARHLSIAPPVSFYVLAVLNAGGVLGRVLPAYVSDSIGKFNLLAPCAFFAGLSCLVVWMFAKSLTTLMVFAAIYGFFSGAFISVINPCVAQISHIRLIGTRIGLLYSIISFPSLLGGPTAGALLSHNHGSFTAMIIFSGSTIVAGSIFIIGSRIVIDSKLMARV